MFVQQANMGHVLQTANCFTLYGVLPQIRGEEILHDMIAYFFSLYFFKTAV